MVKINNKIGGILITFFPDEELIKTINSIYKQVDLLYIIDNTPNEKENINLKKKLNKYQNIKLTKLGKNIGIAAAQNIGIKYFEQENFGYILLSDQDTIFPNNYVENMLSSFKRMEKKDKKISAMAPTFINKNNNKKQGFVIFNGFFRKKIYPQKGLHSIDQAINSGQIIKTAIFKNVGYFNEKLFIDWVDLEWCWRVKRNNFSIYGNANTTVFHRLGEKNFGKYSLHSPLRNYYIIRNATFLTKNSREINWKMKITLFFVIIKYLIGFPLLSNQKIKTLKYCLNGIHDGLTNNMGKKYEEN